MITVEKLQEMPANWTLDHDEDLAQFLSDHVEVDNENLGSIKNFVESIDVSSFCVRFCITFSLQILSLRIALKF